MEAVLAGAVASNARVVAGVGARRCVEYQRTDSVLVDHDLVQSVFEHLHTDSNDDAAKKSRKTSAKLSPSYFIQARPLTESDLLSMDFVINRLLTKLFKTSNIIITSNIVSNVFHLICQAICDENE